MKRDNAKNLNVSSTHTRKRTSSPRPSPPTSLGGEGVKRARTGLIPSPREERAGRGTGACVSCDCRRETLRQNAKGNRCHCNFLVHLSAHQRAAAEGLAAESSVGR